MASRRFSDVRVKRESNERLKNVHLSRLEEDILILKCRFKHQFVGGFGFSFTLLFHHRIQNILE